MTFTDPNPDIKVTPYAAVLCDSWAS